MLLWERRFHSISYVGTLFPWVPAPLHHWLPVRYVAGDVTFTCDVNAFSGYCFRWHPGCVRQTGSP